MLPEEFLATLSELGQTIDSFLLKHLSLLI